MMRIEWLAFGLALSLTGLHGQTEAWKPPLNTTWQWQLTVPVDRTVDVNMYDIDLFNNDASVVSALHASGRRAICYMSAGSFEDFRPDAGSFPAAVKGSVLDGFPNEKWLDIRRIDVLGPIMEARMDLCKAKGFDGIEPDNVDGYRNKTGFTLSAADQIRYNTYLANAAHARGLSVGLKNDLDQVRDLVGVFDWAINEQCFEFQECGSLTPFIAAGKAVFHVEYKLSASSFCGQANASNFNSMRKNLALDVYREACRSGPAKLTRLYPNGIGNGASFQAGPIAPGEIVSIFGTQIGPNTGVALKLTPGGTVDSSLSDTKVYFDDMAAPIVFAQANQINAVVPYGVSSKQNVQVQVEYKSIRTDPMPMQVAQVSPALFTLSPTGSGPGAILNEDNSVNSARNPAARGRTVMLFGTGEGVTDPAGIDGRVAGDVLPKPAAPVSVQIGGINAEVSYAGAEHILIEG